jgi:hypothetical protein
MRVIEREPGDAAELYRRARSERNALQRDRYRAVLLALEGSEATGIGKALGRARRSVQDWVYAYRDGGIENLQPRPRPGRPTKLPREREAELMARRSTPAPRPPTGASARCAAGTSSPSSSVSSACATARTAPTTCSNAWATPA